MASFPYVETNSTVSKESTVVGIISNVSNPPETPDFTVNLTTTDICETEFLQLFFNYTTFGFQINSYNVQNPILSLRGKKYVSPANQKIPFNLPQLVLAYVAQKNATTNNAISSLNKLSALKLSSDIQSLAQVSGFQKAFSWFEVIDLLTASNVIEPSTNPSAIAVAPLIVQFIFVDPSVNLSIAINYIFNVSLPCYINPVVSSTIPCHYSKHEITKKPTHVKFGNNSDDDDSISGDSMSGYSISNSIIQQIKQVQQDSSSEENDNLSVSDDASAWA